MAIIKGSSKNDTLNGSLGDDRLFGYDDNDFLTGSDGNDLLYGGLGADTMAGGIGEDVYFIDNINDNVTELAEAGNDIVYASVSFILPSYVENLVLTASTALNGIGNFSDNSIAGNNAANKLIGNAGNDTLIGGFGLDSLYGSSGDDWLIVKDFNGDVINGGVGNDTLKITGSRQHIDLSLPNTVIRGIETIEFAGVGKNSLKVTAQSFLDSFGTNALTVNGDAGDTLYLDVGWTNGGIDQGYQIFRQQGVTLKVAEALKIQQTFQPTYTISDMATAAKVGDFFTDAAQTVLIDLGGIRYSHSDLNKGVIDLSGFGLEDTLQIAVHDGLIHTSKAQYGMTHYINQISHGTHHGFYTSSGDQVLWEKKSGIAKLISFSLSTSAITRFTFGSIQIVGIPNDLPNNHFVFV